MCSASNQLLITRSDCFQLVETRKVIVLFTGSPRQLPRVEPPLPCNRTHIYETVIGYILHINMQKHALRLLKYTLLRTYFMPTTTPTRKLPDSSPKTSKKSSAFPGFQFCMGYRNDDAVLILCMQLLFCYLDMGQL